MDTVVVGAGIGGLTAALALAREGHRVTVVEAAAGHTAAGAGIVLAPNAVHVLADLGVSLVGEGQVLTSTALRTGSGRLLSTMSPGRLAVRYGPTYGIARARLHEVLVRALPDVVDVHLGRRVESVVEDGDRVRLVGPDVDLDADLVVAADGLRSVVRSGIPGGPGRLRYSGTTCWRGVVDFEAGATATEAWGGSTRVGVVPIGEGRTYYYLVADMAPGSVGPTDLSELATHFAGYGGVAGQLLGDLPEFPPLRHDLFELDRPVWGSGRVLLLGDAAHGMTPNQGQGAAMAIEDAKALVLALRDGADRALERYRGTRAGRVRAVQVTSRRVGQVAHWTHPVATRLRTAAMVATPDRAMDRRLTALVRPGVDLAAVR